GEVPEDNPFDDSLLFSRGHRNPQGIAWDEQGTMYAWGFGQDTWEELNGIEAGGNYGCPEGEGGAGQDGAAAGGSDDFSGPRQHRAGEGRSDDCTGAMRQWPPSQASPSGMAVTDQSSVIAGPRGQPLREVAFDDLSTSTLLWAGEHGRLRDVARAPDGSLV